MGDSPFIGADKEPKLIFCAVLYFDFLGVSAMAQGSEAETELLRFNKTIRDAFPYTIGAAAARENRGAYPTSVFSDSVVAAVPLQEGVPAGLAIFQLALEVAKLQSELATRDYFARGAITLDLFHSYDGLLFGPALVEAANLERAFAVNPRIVLSPTAAKTLLEGDSETTYREAPVLVDEDGFAFVDYLSGAFQSDPELDLPAKLGEHRKVVRERLKRHATNYGRWSKHRWVAEYHNATCHTYRPLLGEGAFEELLIDSIHTRRDFTELTPGGRGGIAAPRGGVPDG